MKLREPPYFTVATKSGHIGNLGCSQNNRNWPLQISWPLPTSAPTFDPEPEYSFMRWTSYCLIKHIYLEPINTSKPRTKAVLKQNKVLLASKCNIYISCGVAQLGTNHSLLIGVCVQEKWQCTSTLNDSWFLTLFWGGRETSPKSKSSQKSNKAITVWPLPIWSCPKNRPFFSRTNSVKN